MRQTLPLWLPRGTVEAVGRWENGRLASVIAWRPERDPALHRFGAVWEVAALATDASYRRHRHAWALKTWLLGEAYAQGVRFLTSAVHWDNTAMLDLNKKLGGHQVAIRRGAYGTFDKEYCRCIVPATGQTYPP